MPDDREPIVRPWRGVPNYQCRLCPYSTLDAERFRKHMSVRHPSVSIREGEAEDDSSTPPLLDPLGELSNEAFEALSPQEKGARTRKANEQQESS